MLAALHSFVNCLGSRGSLHRLVKPPAPRPAPRRVETVLTTFGTVTIGYATGAAGVTVGLAMKGCVIAAV